MQNRVSILSTRKLNAELVEQAGLKGVVIDTISFIETQVIQSVEVQQEIEQALMLTTAVVFTSVKAVEAVAEELKGHRPGWEIFCIGHATRQAVEKNFAKHLVSGIAENASALAKTIVESGADEVIFFCGDKRRDELPDLLHEHGVEVNEITVYHTATIPQKVEKKYNGILFFSPSAVKSFFQKNKPNGQTVLFAIGKTTANEIKNFSENKIVISEEPDKRKFLEKVISYFETRSIHH